MIDKETLKRIEKNNKWLGKEMRREANDNIFTRLLGGLKAQAVKDFRNER